MRIKIGKLLIMVLWGDTLDHLNKMVEKGNKHLEKIEAIIELK